MGNLLIRCLNSLHQSANETHKKVIENFGYGGEVAKFAIGCMLSVSKRNISKVLLEHIKEDVDVKESK